MKNGKSYLPKAEEIKRKWHFIDAEGQVLGRLAVRVSTLLTGKRKAIYASALTAEIFVVLTNVSKCFKPEKNLNRKRRFLTRDIPEAESWFLIQN
jgi:large subunit ribosomal protein L13